MNPQDTIIAPSAPVPPPKRGANLSLILIIFLAIGTVGFGIASILAYNKAHTATATLEAAKKTAATNAANAQKEADDKATVLANESPYRTYTAPDEFGAFSISFPKNWGLSVNLAGGSTVQVTMEMHPNLFRSVNGTIDLLAAKITLERTPLAAYVAKYNPKKVTRTNVTVAGIAGIQLTGTMPDKRAVTIVAIPVRDKVLVFDNEDKAYAAEFQAILAQAKINP